MSLLYANLFSVACVCCATVLIILDKQGWGWLLFFAFVGLHTASTKDDK